MKFARLTIEEWREYFVCEDSAYWTDHDNMYHMAQGFEEALKKIEELQAKLDLNPAPAN